MSEHPGFDLKVFGPLGAWLGPMFQAPMFGTNGVFRSADPTSGEALAGNPVQLVTAQAGQALKACGRCQLEMMGVANRRAQAYLHLASRLAECRSPVDLFEVQMDFWQTAAGQYMDASRRMMEIAGAVMPAAPAVEAAGRDRDYIDFAPAQQREREPRRAREPRTGDAQRRVA